MDGIALVDVPAKARGVARDRPRRQSADRRWPKPWRRSLVAEIKVAKPAQLSFSI